MICGALIVAKRRTYILEFLLHSHSGLLPYTSHNTSLVLRICQKENLDALAVIACYIGIRQFCMPNN